MSQQPDPSANKRSLFQTLAFDAQSSLEQEGDRAAQLVVVEGPSQGQVFVLGDGVHTLGRQENCEILLSSNTVSRQHATVSQQGGLYYLEDNGSINGVYLNGQKIPPSQSCLLRHGDTLRLGEFVLLFKHDEKLSEAAKFSSISLDTGKITKAVDEFLKDMAEEDEETDSPK